MKKRRIDVAVISDVHLGSPGCRAEELLAYLSSIKPSLLVLNGDIIDLRNSGNAHFPTAHTKVLKKILGMASSGTKVCYVAGNHDEMLRRLTGAVIGDLSFCNKLVLPLDGRRAWIFHGDIFDHSAGPAKWLAPLGNWGYSLLIGTNRLINWLLARAGRRKYSLSERIRNRGERGERYASKFERAASGLAIENQYDYVICGHIHRPKKEWVETPKGRVLYMNSGDWVENLTALEYAFKRWKLYRYSEDKLSPFYADEELKEMDIDDLIASIIGPKPPKAR